MGYPLQIQKIYAVMQAPLQSITINFGTLLAKVGANHILDTPEDREARRAACLRAEQAELNALGSLKE